MRFDLKYLNRFKVPIFVFLFGFGNLAQAQIDSKFESAFVRFTPSYKLTESNCVKDIPKARTQDAIGMCVAFSAAAMMEMNICKNKRKANPNFKCEDLKDNERPSAIAVGNLTEDTDKMEAAGLDVSDLNSFKKIREGGFAGDVLLLVSNNFTAVGSEACAPFTKFVTEFWDDNDKQEAAVLDLRKKVNSIIDKGGASQKECTEVANQIKAKFPNLGTVEQISRALSEKSFAEFLYKVSLPENCKTDLSKMVGTHYQKDISYFPMDKAESEKTNFENTYTRMKKIVANDHAMVVDGICMDKKPPEKKKDCVDLHTTVVTCTGTMCDQNGKCFEAVRVLNSWGEKWQKENSDGWVVAKEFLNRTYYSTGAFVWIK